MKLIFAIRNWSRLLQGSLRFDLHTSEARCEFAKQYAAMGGQFFFTGIGLLLTLIIQGREIIPILQAILLAIATMLIVASFSMRVRALKIIDKENFSCHS